jgi:hypothetical protein
VPQPSRRPQPIIVLWQGYADTRLTLVLPLSLPRPRWVRCRRRFSPCTIPAPQPPRPLLPSCTARSPRTPLRRPRSLDGDDKGLHAAGGCQSPKGGARHCGRSTPSRRNAAPSSSAGSRPPPNPMSHPVSVISNWKQPETSIW